MNTQQESVMNGLNTDQCAVPSAGMYSLTVRSTLIPASGIVITATQTGSTTTTFTSAATSPVSPDNQLTAQFNCAAGDIITVAVTSSTAFPADQPPSLLKTTINLRQGR
jgi:hypothetical protein